MANIARLSELFTEVLDSNGHMGVGIAGSTELGTPEDKRIPIPNNLLAICAGNPTTSEMTTRLLHLATWSMNQYLVKNAGDDLGAAGVYFAWVSGCVCVKLNGAGPVTRAELGRSQFDTEVRYVDEQCAGFTAPIPTSEVARFRPTLWKLGPKIVTLVVAAKLTWWTMQHHLGSALKKSVGSGTDARHYQGFLEKVVKTIDLPDIGFDTPEERKIIYDIVHPWSTLSVFGRLLKVPGIVGVNPIPFYHEPGNPAASPPTPDTRFCARFVEFAIQPDVEMRKMAFGAGYAKLADMVAAIAFASRHPMFPFAPGLASLNAVLTDFEKVTKVPHEYGIAAYYLTGSKLEKNWDIGAHAELQASLATWLSYFAETHSLRRAAIFKDDPTIMNGYDTTFAHQCQAFKRAMKKGTDLNEAQVMALASAAGGIVGGDIPAHVIALINRCGGKVEKVRLDSFIAAVAAVGGPPGIIVPGTQQAASGQQTAPPTAGHGPTV